MSQSTVEGTTHRHYSVLPIEQVQIGQLRQLAARPNQQRSLAWKHWGFLGPAWDLFGNANRSGKVLLGLVSPFHAAP
ncbi:hypothetical protein [Pseudacidovorax sp. RU35E]|uniref:hypothetical protein n=1 Tax=Pseudacidovorax sp. RU35E TaxID=1907403 RepID=UPI00117ADE22|nr:hypothetical protein [Pseudacidovorax sp. RU35E]